MMLDVTVLREGKPVYSNIALNDAVISKGSVARAVSYTHLASNCGLMRHATSPPSRSRAYSAGKISFSEIDVYKRQVEP